MVTVPNSGQMGENTLDNGITIKNTEKDSLPGLMGDDTKVTTSMITSMDREYSTGNLDEAIMVHG